MEGRREKIKKQLKAFNPSAHPYIIDNLALRIGKLIKRKEEGCDYPLVEGDLEKFVGLHTSYLSSKLYRVGFQVGDLMWVRGFAFLSEVSHKKLEWVFTQMAAKSDSLWAGYPLEYINDVHFKLVEEAVLSEEERDMEIIHEGDFTLPFSVAFEHSSGETNSKLQWFEENDFSFQNKKVALRFENRSLVGGIKEEKQSPTSKDFIYLTMLFSHHDLEHQNYWGAFPNINRITGDAYCTPPKDASLGSHRWLTTWGSLQEAIDWLQEKAGTMHNLKVPNLEVLD